MPPRLDITPRALDHLDDIQTSLDDQRSGRANKFIGKLRQVGKLLLIFPEMGIPKESLGQGMRAHHVWDYLLLYRMTGDNVRVEATSTLLATLKPRFGKSKSWVFDAPWPLLVQF
jgi:plasmid stabilization system protein ParE